jgi:predicted MFS family arabinose efflux permease
LIVLRALGGLGQGLALIGTQSALLGAAPPEAKTRGASVLVLGYQTGMIAGAAFGSLLAVYTSEAVVFRVAAILGCVALLFGAHFLRRLAPGAEQQKDAAAASMASAEGEVGKAAIAGRSQLSWLRILGDREILTTVFLVGVPTKAMASGVVYFALPLLLAEAGFDADSIGQVLMLYAIGVLLANRWVAGATRRMGGTHPALTLGMFGAGLMLITLGLGALAEARALGQLGALLLSGGAWGLGLAHGLVNAPTVSRIAESRLARRFGADELGSSYRFVERLGSVAGPVLVAQVLALGSLGLGGLGLGALALAGIFAGVGKERIDPSRRTP